MQLQNGRGDRHPTHCPVKSAPVCARDRTQRPPVVLQGAVRSVGMHEGRAVLAINFGGEPRWVGGPIPQESADARRPIGHQRPFRHPRTLKSQNIGGCPLLRPVVDHGRSQSGGMGHGHGCNRSDRIRMQRGGGPGEKGAPAVPDDGRLCRTQGPDHTDDVPTAGERVVTTGCVITAAVTAEVHRRHSIASGSQRREIGPPRPPIRREAMQQQYQRPVAGFRDMETCPVGRHLTVLPRPGWPQHRIGDEQGVPPRDVAGAGGTFSYSG